MPKKPTDEWEAVLNQAGVPASRVRTLDEAATHAQIESRTGLQTYPGSTEPGHPSALPVAGFTYEHGGPMIKSAPPKVGEHTSDVLSDLGYSNDWIEILQAQNVISVL